MIDMCMCHVVLVFRRRAKMLKKEIPRNNRRKENMDQGTQLIAYKSFDNVTGW